MHNNIYTKGRDYCFQRYEQDIKAFSTLPRTAATLKNLLFLLCVVITEHLMLGNEQRPCNHRVSAPQHHTVSAFLAVTPHGKERERKQLFTKRACIQGRKEGREMWGWCQVLLLQPTLMSQEKIQD